MAQFIEIPFVTFTQEIGAYTKKHEGLTCMLPLRDKAQNTAFHKINSQFTSFIPPNSITWKLKLNA